jgi:hypothetical protein
VAPRTRRNQAVYRIMAYSLPAACAPPGVRQLAGIGGVQAPVGLAIPVYGMGSGAAYVPTFAVPIPVRHSP